MIKKTMAVIFFSASTTALLAGCGKNSLQSSGDQRSILSQYTKPATYYGIFYQPSDVTLPPYKTADFDKLDTSGTLPSHLIKNEFGDRSNLTTPQPLNYFIRSVKINSTYASGDYFYEAPILSERYELNAGATALTQILKYSFNQTISLSRIRWEQILLQVELAVGNMDRLTTSQIIDKASKNSSLMTSIATLVKTQNPSVVFTGYNPPETILVWSHPPLAPGEKNKSIKQVVHENSELFVWLSLWNPKDSTLRVLPEFWKHKKNDASEQLIGPQETYVYYLDYNSQGEHILSAFKTIAGIEQQFDFAFDVYNENILPEWATGLSLQFIENHANSIDLNQLSQGLPGASDPDGGVLLYSLVQDALVPSGMIVKAEGGTHYIKWTPNGADPNLKRSGTVNIVAQDSDGGSVAVGIPFTVVPDSLPKISSIPTTWSLTEGIDNSIVIETQDADLDPVIPICTLAPSGSLIMGSPNGAGFFSFEEEPGSVLGHQIFRAHLTPSFLETIGSDKTLSLKCTVTYNGAGLVPLINNDPHLIEASLTNADDPPVWTGSADFEEFAVTEGQAFSGLVVDSVFDPSPNPTAMTYEVTPVGFASGCGWNDGGGELTISETINGGQSELTLSGTAIYASSPTCNFVVVATDANGLSSTSSSFTLLTIDVNRPPSVITDPAPETNFSVDAGKLLTFIASPFFTDPDLSENDPRETLTYSCTECSSISEITFNSTSGSFIWVPNASRADNSPYTFTINATDKGGAVASTTVNITVIDTPAPALLTLSTQFLKVNELSGNHALDLTITAASSQPVDSFNYNLVAQGTCRPGLIINASGTTSGTTDSAGEVISFALNPNKTTDGNAFFPGLSKSCLMTFTVSKSDDPTVTSSINIPITINNVNRAPNTLIIAGDSNVATYNLNLTAGPSDFISGIWIKTHKVSVGVNDSDAIEDPNVDSFSYTSQLGSVSQGFWNFKLPNCLRYESGNISSITTSLTVDDGRGGQRTRSVKINVNNARNIGCP